jgi:hypothetical protein
MLDPNQQGDHAMPQRSNTDDERLDPRPATPDEAPETEDTEGHMFLPSDPGTARALAQGRSADMQREARERQRQKEARPNRR